MSKWKCEICGSGFDNFHAQGFDNMIYCPLCYFKKLSADLQVENEELKKQQREFIKYLEVERERCLTFYCRTECAYAYDVFKGVLAKYKSIIGVEDEK